MAVVLHTTQGDLPILLHYQACPKASYNFLSLCATGYYDGCAFYRHMPGVLLQSGDPTNTGKGGESIFAQLPRDKDKDNSNTAHDKAAASALPTTITTPSRFFDDEGFGVTTHNARGVLSMAHAGTRPHTNASQFFITCQPLPAFDNVYTAFGSVVLAGCYDAATSRIVRAPVTHDDNGDDGDAAVAARCGDAVLRALERAAVGDERNKVVAMDAVVVRGATVLYNPFAEGRMSV